MKNEPLKAALSLISGRGNNKDFTSLRRMKDPAHKSQNQESLFQLKNYENMSKSMECFKLIAEMQ